MSEDIESGRARRRNVKRVDYSKEQEFSDDDLFEDSPVEEPPKTRRGRKSKGGTGVRTAVVTTATTQDADNEDDLYENRPIYTEKGYDPSLPPIRERFPFLPEYEEDGSPKIELIVGRRPVDEKEDVAEEAKEGDLEDDEDEDGDEAGPSSRRRSVKKKNEVKKKKDSNNEGGTVEYEYLVKYRGRSYLHLEWKTGADLESMNKSAKGIYRRYLKKVLAGVEEDLENPDFDPSYVIPEKILDEAEQEITVELTDKELLRWEKQREKELEEEEDDADEEEDEEKEETSAKDEDQPKDSSAENGGKKSSAEDEAGKSEGKDGEEEKKENTPEENDDWSDDELDFSKLTLDKLRAIVNREGSYYPVVEGSDNPYRDGYITEPPKKPRASYLFFQCTMRSYFQKKHRNARQSELMTILGDKWGTLTDEEKAPFLQLAKEESEQYEKEKVLLAKAQRANEVWQPLRRCKMVLDRLTSDSFSEIFLEPVNVDDFPDYEEVIDFPMDLGTIRQKLENKKYQAPEQFARDMRRVWNNCKIYNQHGSAIWHVADYMSKQFERLYHAWVLEFRERYLRWADPRARPWEHTCRMHDGTCNTPDDQMVLCDHCDAMYGIKCLQPPLKKIPSKAWHCRDCKPKLKSVKGIRMLSAVAENAARKRAELGDLPKKKVKQIMYLVKWKGLGYEFCTWETKADINDDALVAEYHRINDSHLDDTELSVEVVHKALENAEHLKEEFAGGVVSIPNLRAQLYAQTRAFEFAKFGMDLPALLCSECGPKTKSVLTTPLEDPFTSANEPLSKGYPREVVDCVADMVFKVARREPISKIRNNTSMPPPMTGEYDAIVPITSKGLMMNVGEIHGSVAFLGYRRFPDGSRGPSEIANLIRNVGDKIIAVDGVSTIGKTFKEVICMLRESGKNKFAFMRFLENRYSVCESDLASVGSKGRYAIEVLQKKFTSDRQRMVVHRAQHLLDEDQPGEEEKEKDDSTAQKDSDEESEDDGSEGEFQPDSEDEELAEQQSQDAKSPDETQGVPAEQDSTADDLNTEPASDSEKAAEETKPEEAEKLIDESKPENGEKAAEEAKAAATKAEGGHPEDIPSRADGILSQYETTQSLAYRLLDVDVDYSSDEGGDDDCAYFLDGVDDTFARADESENLIGDDSRKKGKKSNEEIAQTVPAKQSEFSSLGDRAKLTAAVALSVSPPDVNEFDNFPNPSTAKLAAMEEKKKEAQAEASPSPAKQTKRSTVKVEQISISTGEVLHIWANVESAAATLQLPLPALRQVLKGEYDEEIGDEVGGFKWRYALAGAKVTAGAGSSRGGGGKKAKEAWLEFRDKLYDPNEPHIYKNGNRLRDYQVDGVNWLSSTWYKRQGCILADEMGLGKTVQIVCYIEHLFRVEKIRRPYLVVVPLSTIEHWRREFEGWTDMICCIYHDRQRVWRDVLREYEWYFEDKPHTPEFLKFDVLVTTYDTLIGDFDVISQIPFRVAIVDEAHRLRNQKGKLLECMREISAKGTMAYGFQSRVLMSGTPLQNDLTELWTLLNFIEPFKFPDLDNFLLNFGNMANREQVERLQNMISPFMLRRVKEDVAKDIPAKEETVIDVELTSIQKQYYRAIFEHNHAFLNMGATRQNAPKLMNIQMELRKVCNHPFLLDGVEHREIDRLYKEFSEEGAFQGKTAEEQQRMINEQGYVFSSGKMVLLDKLLPKLRQEGHKILIFSQMVKMLDLISEYCEYRNFRYERLDGRVRGTERQKAIDRFERDDDSFLFLLSTRAGGVGINLTAADIVVIFDSDWNPQNDIQAQARCHRIGQTKDVRIYRLVTSRSFEQEMFDRASKKLGLEQAVLGTFEKETEDDKPTQEEMEQLLKKGAYALLEDESDEITNQFCADDIESILAKRTRTRVVEGAKTASWLNKQGMVVSKSKFSAETGGDALDLDDPLFWQKVMPDFVTPSLMMQKLNDLQDDIEGRVRGPGRGRKRGRGRPKKNAEVDADEERRDVATDADADNAANEGEKANDKSADDQKPAEDGESQPAEPVDPAVDALLADETLEEMSEPDEEDEDDTGDKKGKRAKVQLSRANVRKVQKFMNDLKSMMESIFEDEEDDEGLTNDEKAACQKLLLTISVKENIFTEEQRHLARVFLKRIEGDRRRRCRTSERFTPGKQEEETGNVIPNQLMIVGKKRKKRKKRGESALDDEESGKRKRRRRTSDGSGGYVGEDGYLHHSDSEEDWSIVGDDIYGTGKGKDRISSKEAKRRRQWCSGDDGPTAAGRAWPVFPRHTVKQVLSSVLEEMIKYDRENGGVFSEPVPKDDFPEYYEQIKKPMDYSTMKSKLENGEYRSAQAMQKDFILILQNCREFNARNSDIVKEAYEQHLLRPKLLKEAAMKHGLFLSEDGSVLEIFDDEKKKSPKKKRVKKKKGKEGASDEESGDEKASKKKKKANKKKKKDSDDEEEAEGSDGEEEESEQKPRIRIKVKGPNAGDDDVDEQPARKGKKKNKRKRVQIADAGDDGADADAEETPAPKRRKKASDSLSKKRGKRVTTEGKPEKVDESVDPMFDVAAQKKEREQLDGTFQAARENLTKNGQWKLPESIEGKFSDVATLCLAKMDRNDRYSVFAEEVSEEEAPGYAEVVKHPMDFGTMRKKVLTGSYGTGSEAAAALYEDFLLVFDNCDLYNSEDSEVTEEATRVLSLLPETYAYACATVSKKR